MSLTTLVATNSLIAAALALTAWGASRICRNPAPIHVAWVAVLSKLFLPPLLVVPILTAAPVDVFGAVFSTTESLPVVTGGPPAPQSSPSSLATMLIVVWLAGAISSLALSLDAARRFATLLRAGRPAPPELRARIKDLSRRTGLRRAPRVRLLDLPVTPMLWGLRPLLVIPSRLPDRLTSDQLDAVIVHELVHLRRRDHWVRLLEWAARVVYWWHPAVWWATRELRRYEEMSCDAGVVGIVKNARAYADGLLETLAFVSRPRRDRFLPLTSGATEARNLKGRLLMILDRKRSARPLSPLVAGALAGLLLLALAVFPTGAHDASTRTITLRAHDEALVEVLRQIAAGTDLNWVIHPGVPVDKKVTVALDGAPLVEALGSLQKLTGVAFTWTVNVMEVHPRHVALDRRAAFQGQPIDIDVDGVALEEVIDQIAGTTGLRFELPQDFDARVSMKLSDVSWDLALEVLLSLNDLTYAIEGNVVRVTPRA